MKNLLFSPLIIFGALSVGMFANKNLNESIFYVQDITGNYILMMSTDFTPLNCSFEAPRSCAYRQVRTNILLPDTLNYEQVLQLSDPILGPITLDPVVTTLNSPVYGYYSND